VDLGIKDGVVSDEIVSTASPGDDSFTRT